MITIIIPLTLINGVRFAGEFKHEGVLYCAAFIPTPTGMQWQLEKQLTTDKQINDWAKVPATFKKKGELLHITFSGHG